MNNTLNLIFSKYGKFSNTIRILIIIQFLISIVNGIISFLLIFYIRALGYSPIIYGIMTSITGLVFLITIVPSGVISSRIGAKGMINLGIISSILSLLILVFFESIPLVNYPALTDWTPASPVTLGFSLQRQCLLSHAEYALCIRACYL
ncbi:MAG: hypothetical protein QXF30_04595 [Thermoplasmata archaeon]